MSLSRQPKIWVPNKQEALNYLIWREQDAARNSIQMLAQSLFSHKELQGKNHSELHEMCFSKGINWNDLDQWKKNGTFYLDRELRNFTRLTQEGSLNQFKQFFEVEE